jgi:peptidoglycan/LPS O-acetylase OafA/YrhL
MVFALLPFQNGHPAVLFFFVLSGFVIHLRYSRKLAAGERIDNFDWLPYLKRRVRRIYPPLLFSLALVFVLDSIGSSLGYTIYSNQTFDKNINAAIDNQLDLITLVGNLVFMMKVYVPAFGSNGPLWSLMYEWWFYMLYPILLLINRYSIKISNLAVVGLFAVSFIPGLPIPLLLSKVFGYLLSWWIGVMLADAYTGRLCIPIYWVVTGVLLLPFNFLLPDIFSNVHIKDTSLAVSFGALLLLAMKSSTWYTQWLKWLKWLGDCSYTFYITHFPFMILLSGWLMNSYHNQLPKTPLYAVLSVPITLAFAYRVHFLVEKPFMNHKNRTAQTGRVKNVKEQKREAA